MASWAPDDAAAMDGAREWKGTLVDENYTEPVVVSGSDPTGMLRTYGEHVQPQLRKR